MSPGAPKLAPGDAAQRIVRYHTQGTDIDVPIEYRIDALAVARALLAASRLVDELKALCRAYVSLLEHGRDRILDLGGTCDPVNVMEKGDPALARARAAVVDAAAPRVGPLLELVAALRAARQELWDQMHSHMSAAEFIIDPVIEQIDEALAKVEVA